MTTNKKAAFSEVLTSAYAPATTEPGQPAPSGRWYDWWVDDQTEWHGPGAVAFLANGSGADRVSLSLKPGWNLVSLSVQPQDPSMATVLEPLTGRYLSVWAYEAGEADPWRGAGRRSGYRKQGGANLKSYLIMEIRQTCCFIRDASSP